jgi:hypothetical protein
MSFGDPVEFIRTSCAGDKQRVGNRIQKEAFTIDCDYFAHGLPGDANQIILAAPGANQHWRFDYIHYSYNGVPAGAYLDVDFGLFTYRMYITAAGPGWVPFDTTRFPAGTAVTITLTGSPQISGSLHILGARVECLQGG